MTGKMDHRYPLQSQPPGSQDIKGLVIGEIIGSRRGFKKDHWSQITLQLDMACNLLCSATDHSIISPAAEKAGKTLLNPLWDVANLGHG
jgi:hypothetical protein